MHAVGSVKHLRQLSGNCPLRHNDEMEEGHFKSFKHEHSFVEKDGKTVMIDNINYETPFGVFGKLFDKIILKKHLTNFILNRNKMLKELAENQH